MSRELIASLSSLDKAIGDSVEALNKVRADGIESMKEFSFTESSTVTSP